MTVCDFCKQEMTAATTTSCTITRLPFKGGALDRIPYPADEDRRCGDCYVAPGGQHHFGCDNERCPRCGRQLLGCGCEFAEE